MVVKEAFQGIRGRSPREAETLSAFGRSMEAQKLISYTGFSFFRTFQDLKL